MRNYSAIGIQIPEILLPKAGVDLSKWAVIACDQYTSQPEYWEKVRDIVGNEPSTYHLILPEVFLGGAEEAARVQNTQQEMRHYLQEKLLVSREGMVYVERTIDGKTRRGLVLALDLEKYDYNKGSQSLIRATEGTILDRLPPRIKIRKGAALELPHILVLIDDPDRTVIEPLTGYKSRLPKLYDFDLMMGSGHLSGYLIHDPLLEKKVVQALEKLSDPAAFSAKYGVGNQENVLLFAMGDGNHSLATAKAIWERIKPQVGLHHPARYALVEIENVHDEALNFEPIHRVVFGVTVDPLAELGKMFGSDFRYEPATGCDAMAKIVDEHRGPEQAIGFVNANRTGLIYLSNPSSNLPVGTLQAFLDDYLKKGCAAKIDYVHGQDVVCKLGTEPGNAGFYVPGMEKGDLFKTVILDGALPRKTFSMGEAREKRFYMECRKIS
jgi:hypothetical protein